MWDMCQILNIWHISHTKHNLTNLLDISYLIFFATCYSIVINLPRYGTLVAYDIFFVYSFFSLISPLVSPFSPQSSPLSLTSILTALPHPCQCQCRRSLPCRCLHRSLSSNGLSVFIFFCCGLMGSVPTEVSGFGWTRL